MQSEGGGDNIQQLQEALDQSSIENKSEIQS